MMYLDFFYVYYCSKVVRWDLPLNQVLGVVWSTRPYQLTQALFLYLEENNK